MKKILLGLFSLLALTFSAEAQQTSRARIVATCGTPPSGYTVPGVDRNLLMDTTGVLCTSAGGGGGGGDASAANQTSQITQETAIAGGVGTAADAAATQGSTGSVNAKLRLLTAQLNTQAGYLDGLEAALLSSATNVTPGAALATTSFMIGARYLSTPPTFTNGQEGGLQIDSAGRLLVVPSGGSLGAEYDATPEAIAEGTSTLQTDDEQNLKVTIVDENKDPVDWLTPSTVSLPQENTLPTESWRYAAATAGILATTTAVTIKTADATDRNCIVTVQISSEALGTATEIAFRDGAGGTVMWRSKIGLAGWIDGREMEFSPPLCSTAATLLEFVTLTSSGTGAVYVNAQGMVVP